jgi:hypothetical protein
MPSETQRREWNLGMPLSNQDHLFITDVLAPDGPPFKGRQRWGNIVVQIPPRPGIAIGSIEAQARLVAINAGFQKWPGIVRLRDAGKLILGPCDCDIFALGEASYEDPLGRAWIVNPERGIQPKNPQ